jgi:transcriptional/translational regulatory protein YebC/TACO1
MGESGCVAWIFNRKGYLTIDHAEGLPSEDELMMLALEGGAEDFQTEENSYVILTSTEDFERVKDTFMKENIELSAAEVTMVPSNLIRVEDPDEAARVLSLLEALEEHDDVQNVYANFDIPDEIMQSL